MQSFVIQILPDQRRLTYNLCILSFLLNLVLNLLFFMDLPHIY